MRSFNGYMLLAGKGFCMGAADVIPGVSGGTMAFILGIYEELLSAIRSFDLECLRRLGSFDFRGFLSRFQWRFLLALGSGILAAIFSLARLLSWLLSYHPTYVWSFFFGLVLASVVSVSKRVTHWSPTVLFLLAVSAAGTFIFVGLSPAKMPHEPWFLFLSGALAICAMILPGISGAFVLVLLGQYHYILEAVNQRDLLVLILVASGACAGIIAFSRLLGWLLNNYKDLVITCLTGLMLGSLRKIWPWKFNGVNTIPDVLNRELVLVLALVTAGLLLVIIIDRTKAKSV